MHCENGNRSRAVGAAESPSDTVLQSGGVVGDNDQCLMDASQETRPPAAPHPESLFREIIPFITVNCTPPLGQGLV